MEEKTFVCEDEFGVSLKSYFKEAKSRWWLVLAITVVLAVCGWLFGRFIVKTEYTSTATLYVKVESGSDASVEDMAASRVLSLGFVETYVSFLDENSTIVFDNAIQKLGTDGKGLFVAGVKKCLIVTKKDIQITLKYVSKDKDNVKILDQLVDSLIGEVNCKEGSGYKYGDIANHLHVSSPAKGGTNNEDSKALKYTALGFLVGIVASAVVIFIFAVESEKKALALAKKEQKDATNE